MAFLDYLLGGVSGGFEGYERKKARELQAQKDEEERQFRKLTLLDQFGFQPTGLVDQGAAPGTRKTVADISANLPKPISDTKLGSAFEAARQRGFGIEPPPASPLTSPVSLALDTAKGRQPEQPPRMPQTGPEIQVNTPFGRMGFTRETEEQKLDRELKKFEAQQDVIAKRTAAANDRANRGYFAILKKAGRLPGVEYDDVKDIDLKSAYDELKQERSLTSAMDRAQVAGQYGTYLPGVVGPDGQPQIMFGTRGGTITPTGIGVPQKDDTKGEIQTGLQAMGAARAKTALNLLGSNIKSMDAYEDDLLKNKESFNFAQLEAARLAASGKPGSAAAEAALAKMGTGGAALYRYVRSGKAIANAVREITPRGGSNAMMQMEIVLSGIGPAGVDPESIAQVRAFRNDIYEGVKTGVDAMTQKSSKKNPYR